MKTKTIKALKVEPKKKPCECALVNELSELQKAVSIGADNVGLIEIIDLEEDVCLLCNEEGKLINLEPNRRLGNDILCGVFYIIGQDRCGNLTSLSDRAMRFYKILFNEPEDIDPDEVECCIGINFEIIEGD